MLHKWKLILLNWINCYFDENSKHKSVDSKSVLTIISYLRENLNLDESKSSVLEAATIEEFLREKYPEFTFENGTIDARNEEEMHLVASLLLYFVCVNSKNIDVKSAMCSKLSSEDQETIFKFSKSLMEGSTITYSDVQAAITEACGQEQAASQRSSALVSETPPPLRSLHGEVRRLQAALDAERFDRNYLQDELTRTNCKLEALLKDKEQYKLDIVTLKAKISMCCGQEVEARGGDAAAESSARLLRQLNDTEERLVATQEKLDEATAERDTYKAKINELKKERDKWLNISQQESVRSSQLIEELETEKHTNHQLKELVAELRNHQQRNCLDSSQLECDDPDATAHSFNNASICSEACASIVEVQLMEEKNKVVALQRQIEDFQNQLMDLKQQTENERLSLQAAISEKDNDIFDLKHRINEGVEEKTNIKAYYSDEITKLNNEVNEIEQKLKDANNNYARIIEQKMQEIQTLQEEKLSLLQSLSDETTKLENVIKELKDEIELERSSKRQMREDYENQMMKLNEKVLNRNNELVELQNKVFEKGETIEELQLELRKERESKEELLGDITNLNDEKQKLEQNFRQKFDEAKELQKRLLQNVSVFEEFNKEIDDLKATQSNLEKTLDERNATVHSLKIQLSDEIAYKTKLQNDLAQLQQTKSDLSHEINLLNTEVSQLKKEVHEKDRNIYAIDLYLKEEKHLSKTLKESCDTLTEDLNNKNKEIEELQATIESNSQLFEAEIGVRDEIINDTKNKLASEEQSKDILQNDLKSLEQKKDNLDKELTQKCEEMLQLQINYEKLNEEAQKNINLIETLETKLAAEINKYCELELQFNAESSNFITKLEEVDNALKENTIKYERALKDHELKVQNLGNKMKKMVTVTEETQEKLERYEKENEQLFQALNNETSLKCKIEEEYHKQCDLFKDMTSHFDEDINAKDSEIKCLKSEAATLHKTLTEKTEEIKTFQENLQKEIQLSEELKHDKNNVIKDLQKKLEDITSLKVALDSKLEQEISIKMQSIEALRKENEQLHFAIEEDNSNHEVILKEKDKLIEKLEQKYKNLNVQMESLRKDYEKDKHLWETAKLELNEGIENRENQIHILEEQLESHKTNLEETKLQAECVQNDLIKQMDDIKRHKNNTEIEMKERIVELLAEVNQAEKQLSEREHEIVDLQKQIENEKLIRESIESEKRQLLVRIAEVTLQLSNSHLEIQTLKDEISGLISDKSLLTQEFVEETSNRRILEVEKQKLIEQADEFNKLIDELKCKENSLMEQAKILTDQLTKETESKQGALQQREEFKMAKDELQKQLNECLEIKHLLEEQNDALVKEKNDLIQTINTLNIQLMEDTSVKDSLQTEIRKFIEMLEEERRIRGELFHEKECLLDENEALKFNIIDLNNDKENLMKTLDEEKCARDELETEKNNVANRLEKYIYELTEKTADVNNIMMELSHFKADCKKHEEFNKEVCALLSNGLENLLEKINKEDDGNENLYKFSVQDSMSVKEQCETIVNFAETLANELSLKKKLEVALRNENSALSEMKQLIDMKDDQIAELQKQEQHLEHVIEDTKNDYKKQFEVQNEIIESKTNDIQKLQLDNQSLNNELNNVKYQLEVKVHSLKEKLVDNETLTDKLKKSYECQIDNLNEVVTKLTYRYNTYAYTLHDTVRKEKERLLLTIEENNDVIKSLEEKVKTLNQDHEKLIHDFESERLVLKNMITVTESVMEDQKLSLNNLITEHVKANETLQDENKALQELISLEKNSACQKLQEKEIAFATVFKDITEIRNEKERLEKELEMNSKNMVELKTDLEQKIYNLEEMEIQNKRLIGELTKCKEDLIALQEDYNSLNSLKDSLEFDLLVDINELNKALKLERDKYKSISALQDKLCANISIKSKIKYVCHEVIFLVKENYDLDKENNDYVSQLFKVKDELEVMQRASKENEKISNDNLHLVKIIEENKNVIANLEQLIQHELEQNTMLREEAANEKTAIENKCQLLEQQKLEIEKQLENKNNVITELESTVETVNSIVSEYWEPKLEAYETDTESCKDTVKLIDSVNSLTSKLTVYEQELKEKSDSLMKITQNNNEIVQQLNDYEQQLELKAYTISEIMEEKNKIMEELSVLENNLIKKNEILSSLEQKKDEYVQNVDSKEEIIREKSNELATILNLKESIADKLTSCEQELRDKSEELSEITKQKNVIFEKLKECEAELSNKTELLLSITEEKDSLVAQLEANTKVVKEKDNIIIKANQERDEAITKIYEYQETSKEKEDLLLKAASDIADIENMLNVCEHELQESKNEILKYTQDNNNLAEKLKTFEMNLVNKDEVSTKLIEEKESLNKKLQTREEIITKMTSEMNEILTKLNEYEHVVQEKDELISKAEQERVEYDTKLKSIELELQTKEETITALSLVKDEMTNKLNTYETNIKEKDEQVAQLIQVRCEALKDLEGYDNLLITKDELIEKIGQEKDELIEGLRKELDNETVEKNKYRTELETKIAIVYELQQKINELNLELQSLEALKKENDELLKAVGQRDTFAVVSNDKQSMKYTSQEKERDYHQVSTPTSDLTQSSIESLKTISDLEKIIHDKNRTITTLQSDITYLKSMMAESENKLLDVAKELDLNKENCHQLSSQLKKVVQQKNEEIGDLKKQVSKISVTENRASQIIKVSAKYQAIILKRIAEIKSNTILKELTNFGNASNENELRRGLNSGAVTMEDLENFLETTDRHLKKCSEKQTALQKERDRLTEVNRINESEILHLKKFLTELSVSVKTFDSVRDVYAQKLSRVVSIQRTVRREILNLDGQITEATMCKLERGYAAVMQDLCECTMNLERWMDRCIGRTVSAEKIKQAFTSDHERMSLSANSFQNSGLEVQLGELEISFQKLLEETARATKGEGAKDIQSVTVMEVRAEYEDKLNRMKAKMKQLYQEQIAVFKDKQKEEIAALERELKKAREKLADSSREYEKHIRALTTELWSVGEKYLMKNNEAEWLKKRQYSGSLMSLQHVHSSGISAPPEIPSRPSDSHSLRSLPTHNPKEKRERGLHMSDEEGEVFDNRWLKELTSTPRQSLAKGQSQSLAPGQRMSELKWRNSLCPPHLKSSYPAETQFANTFDEEDIKSTSTVGGRQRKEVGITAYKKPGPPTPSKQAGRLSATDSELRESLRVDLDPHASRKTSTPSRIRALFRSNRNDTNEGTPRTRRLSNIFRKK